MNPADLLSSGLPDGVEASAVGGGHRILRHYPGRAETTCFVKEQFYRGIAQLVSPAQETLIRDAGLKTIHRHLPVSSIPHLKKYVNPLIKEKFHKLAFHVIRDGLGFDGEFWISDQIFTRIHYPFDPGAYAIDEAFSGPSEVGTSRRGVPEDRIARDAGQGSDGATRGDWVRDALSRSAGRLRLFNPTLLLHNIPQVSRELICWLAYRRGVGRYPFRSVQGLETGAVHGPHLDIWNGLPFDGLTLWWAVNRVNQDNGLILYPGMIGWQHDRWIEKRHGQARSGVVLPRPTKITMEEGDALLFRQDAVYHASQLNVSHDTRIVVSTHISLAAPKFSRRTRFVFERFVPSSAIANGIKVCHRFPYRKNLSASEFAEDVPFVDPKRPRVSKRRGKLLDGTPLVACSSEDLADGEKMLVTFDDTAVVLVRSRRGLSCLDAFCPHKGYSLIHGWHDDDRIHCPGHGLSFDVLNGSSACPGLSLSTYNVSESDGLIVVHAPVPKAAPRVQLGR